MFLRICVYLLSLPQIAKKQSGKTHYARISLSKVLEFSLAIKKTYIYNYNDNRSFWHWLITIKVPCLSGQFLRSKSRRNHVQLWSKGTIEFWTKINIITGWAVVEFNSQSFTTFSGVKLTRLLANLMDSLLSPLFRCH